MALKHSYFFRPTSRPTSPSPHSNNGGAPSAAASSLMTTREGTSPERTPRSLNKLAFTSFRRASPAPALAQPAAAPATLTQDGSYLEALSLKLSEAVTKALAQPTTGPVNPQEVLGGRRPIPTGRGTQLGALIAAELNAAAGNVNLRRAIVRSLQRPMSVLLTNVSSKLLPLLSSSAFLDPPAPSVQVPSPNATQLHALGYATFCGEIVDALTQMGLGLDSDMRGDGLRAVREDFASMVGRVVNPLLNGIKADLLPLIEALEHPVPAAQAPVVGAKGVRVVSAAHSSIAALQTLAPVYAKALGRYCMTPTAQTHLAPFLISIVWRALVALAYRAPPMTQPISQPPTPRVQPVGLKKPRSTSSTTPPTTPPAARFMLKLPPSRPPSPPGSHAPAGTTAGDAHALYDLLSTFPRPNAEHNMTRLAREATDEAFDALHALAVLLDAAHAAAVSVPVDIGAELERVGDDLPVLIALPVLLPTLIYAEGGSQQSRAPSLPELLGMSESEYRSGCLAGFGREEECAPLVGRRVLDRFLPLLQDDDGHVSAPLRSSARAVLEWLEDAIESDADGVASH